MVRMKKSSSKKTPAKTAALKKLARKYSLPLFPIDKQLARPTRETTLTTLSNAIVFALLCIALLAAYVFYTNFLQPKTSSPENPLIQLTAPSCVEQQEKNCSTDKGCAGVSVCTGGQWSACIIKKICVPGSIKVCPIQGGCGYGKQTCNECGTNYGECA